MLAIFSTLKADFPSLKQCFGQLGFQKLYLPPWQVKVEIWDLHALTAIASSPVSTSDESCARIFCSSFASNPEWNLKLFYTLPKPITHSKNMLRNPWKPTFWTGWFSWLLGSANTFLSIRDSVTIRAQIGKSSWSQREAVLLCSLCLVIWNETLSTLVATRSFCIRSCAAGLVLLCHIRSFSTGCENTLLQNGLM